MTETKKDVFDDLLDAYGDAIAGGGQGDNGHPAEYRLRYAAASDGDPQCLYCHGDIKKTLMNTNSGTLSIDGATLEESQMWDYYRDEPSDRVRAVPIRFCPMCRRSLGASRDA